MLLAFLLIVGAASDAISDRWPAHPLARFGRPDSTDGDRLPPVMVSAAGASRGDSLLRLDINHASARELDSLPGVGPVLAARILDHRERYGAFREIDDLRAVRGIGPKLFSRIKDRVRLGPPG